jgi:hypothetical protein
MSYHQRAAMMKEKWIRKGEKLNELATMILMMMTIMSMWKKYAKQV